MIWHVTRLLPGWRCKLEVHEAVQDEQRTLVEKRAMVGITDILREFFFAEGCSWLHNSVLPFRLCTLQTEYCA